MSEQKPIKGSIEVISNGNSVGMVVTLSSGIGDVPTIVELAQSLTNVARVEDMPEDVKADAMWTAMAPGGFDAVVLFREDRDLTLQEIAAAIEASKDM